MKDADAPRGIASLLFCGALGIMVMSAVPARTADGPRALAPAAMAEVALAADPGAAGSAGVMSRGEDQVSARPGVQDSPAKDAAGVAPATLSAPAGDAERERNSVAPAAQAAPATASPASTAAAPATQALDSDSTAEAPPENTETAPMLVGPDDDRLLEEVEKHVVIAPAEPAIKISEPAYDIDIELNSKVIDYVEIFQTSRRRSFEAGLLRSRKYEAMMKPVFRELGIPTDLYYLALIESGYNPKAYSYAKAMGIWQFISSTGRIYGLRRTDWIDERRDPEKSTRAAARHLRDLYEDLGSWPLALAAYNAGKGRVQRAIAKAGTTDFWALSLPAQTRNYVPAFYAAVIIGKDPERYGFQPDFEQLEPTEVIEVGGGTRLSLVAALCRTSVDTIQDINPELRKSSVPPGGKYPLKIPAGRAEELIAGLSKVPAGKTTAGVSTYRVASGDTLFSIAQRFGTTAPAIKEASRLKDSELRVGQQLVIPGMRLAEAPIPRAPGRVVVSSATPEAYRVRSGDNPWSVARRFNVALDDLLAWNGLDSAAVLKVGQALVLREPAAGGASSSARAMSASRTYQVRRGDNLWQISRKFDASLEAIRRINGFGEHHDLKPGDRVLLP